MKKWGGLVIIFSIIQCSTPKYTYFFDRQIKAKNNTSVPDDTQIISSLTREGAYPSIVLSAGELVASHDRKGNRFAFEVPALKTIPYDTVPALKKESEKGMSDQKSTTDDGKRVRDKSKNWMAIAGFFSVIAGILGVFFSPLWLLFPIGIVLCKLGLKSEKRGLALSGFVIGLTAAVVGVVILLAFIFSGGSGFGG